MNIKKGDNVVMLTGKDRNKTGKVSSVSNMRVVVDGLNTVKKHQRARKQGQKGQILTKERAVDISNVQVICSKCGKPTRVGHRLSGDKMVRICKKCGADI